MFYTAALFCLAALCASLVLHDACVRRSNVPMATCDVLRRLGTLCAFALAVSLPAMTTDETIARVLLCGLAFALVAANQRHSGAVRST